MLPKKLVLSDLRAARLKSAGHRWSRCPTGRARRTLSSLQAATAGQWIGRQDRRGERQPSALRGTDPGLNLPLGQMAVPDQPLAAGAIGLHRLYDQLPRPRGPGGTGKTHISLGLRLAACQKGRSIGQISIWRGNRRGQYGEGQYGEDCIRRVWWTCACGFARDASGLPGSKESSFGFPYVFGCGLMSYAHRNSCHRFTP